MTGWLESYRQLPPALFAFAGGQFLINLINTSTFLLLNLFLKQTGLDDPQIAALGSYRFLATLFLALPAGLWLRGQRLRRPLLLGSVLFPITTLAALEFARLHWGSLSAAAFLLTGFANLILNVGSLPMAMRLTPPKLLSEAFSLLFSSWAAASIAGGLLATGLQSMGVVNLAGFQLQLDEHATLVILTILAAAAPWFYAKLPDPPPVDGAAATWFRVSRADWASLSRALVPTLCISTGAGLSIQFLNLFFHHVHGLSSAAYSGWGTFSSVLIFIASLLVPEVKRRFGWRGAILGVQGLAIVLLVAMGLTELVKSATWALPFALACFVLRQPLMSMAGPAISELTMAYVGPRNRELMSACAGAIWSGAWWLAARVFQVLRAMEISYWQVFLVTAALYLVGTLAYLTLIRAIESRKME